MSLPSQTVINALPAFPTPPTPIAVPASFDYTLGTNALGSYVTYQGATGMGTYADFQTAMQAFIGTCSTNVANGTVNALGSMNLLYLNSAAGLVFSEDMKMYIPPTTSMTITDLAYTSGILNFDGRYTTDQRAGCVVEGLGGSACIVSAGSGGDGEGIYFRCANNVQLRNLELENISGEVIKFDGDGGGGAAANNGSCLFENINILGYATGVFQHHAIIIDGTYNYFNNITVNGLGAGNSRTCMYIGAETAISKYNFIEHCTLQNSRLDNIIYLNNWSRPVSLNWFNDIEVSGGTRSGFGGIKCRPSCYNQFKDILSYNNNSGIILGCNMVGESAIGYDDGNGGTSDGWSRGNRFIRTNIGTVAVAGVKFEVDNYDGYGVEQTYFDGKIVDSDAYGIWLNNGYAGSSGSGTLRDNSFFFTINGCATSAIRMTANAGSNGYTYRNHFIGAIVDGTAIDIVDAGCTENYFDLAITGACTINDAGLRNRWNGVGSYAYGVGVAPTNSHWYNGDVIINTDDDTVWRKSAGTITQIPSGTHIPQFVWMSGKGGLNVGTVQFIDRSHVANGTITGWDWDFGDTNSGTLQHPQHVYASNGTYVVGLTITDSLANESTTSGTLIIADTDSDLAVYNLVVPNNVGGTFSLTAGTYEIIQRNTQDISVGANPGYVFNNWTIDGVDAGTENPLRVFMYGDHEVDANFTGSTPVYMRWVFTS